MNMQDVYKKRFVDGAEIDDETLRRITDENTLTRLGIRGTNLSEPNPRTGRDGFKKVFSNHVVIHQDVAGSAYFEATTQHGTIAKSHLCNLQDALRWIYCDWDLTFSSKLVEIKHRLNCSDA